ncbi:(deoxy)nucleoside triphosphate pyrophosphohydrolase [Ferrimonas kyonanensis]|uniref:(deoxy)nucleoside triphosphate pyrophosphohydrolase n=1 Tax=Ferrimonas kyonanensis TaxID=364763 RepID=UPI00041EFAE9|nr:(deoxy)nucleoside triphosphate pyrophosphohydrolase [Ferrimonas kyonanensis]
MLDVACALIFDGHKLLLTRRHPDSSQGGLWEFPGGKQEPGETLQQALARELMEELTITLTVGPSLGCNEHHYGSKGVRLHGFLCPWQPQPIRLTGSHDQWQWLAPEDVDTTTLAAADLPLLQALINALPQE